MELILILFILLILLCVALMSRNSVILNPQFSFVACFIPSIIYSLFYIDEWDLDLHPLTFWLFVLGTTTFTVVSIVVGLIGEKTFNKKAGFTEKSIPYIDKWKLWIFAIFQLLTFGWLITFLFSTSGSSNLATAIFYYRYTTVSTEETLDIPSLLYWMRQLCIASGFVWTYILADRFLHRSKVNIFLLILNAVLSALVSVSFGSRTVFIQLLFALFVQFYFLAGKRSGWKLKIKFKYVLRVVLAVAVLLFTFQIFGNLLGRNSTTNFSDYIAKYLSAEIKNLDTFVRAGNFGASIEKKQTFIYLINYLSNRLGIESWYHDLDIPFRTYAGFNLGNVYTIFYSFVYDGGMFGVFFYTALMALLAQIAFLKAAYGKRKEPIELSIMIYSYMFFTIVFSFFSDKFYEMIFNISFVRYIIFWVCIRWFLLHLHVRIRAKS